MLFFGIFSVLLAVVSANFCYNDVDVVCSKFGAGEKVPENPSNCTAKYGSINEHMVSLQSFATANIVFSFDFLLLSSYFGNYEYQREGFQKLYRKYSDDMWEDAVDLIKYMAKRGVMMNFGQLPRVNGSLKVLELNEISSLAKALDSQKQLAQEAMKIHSETRVTYKEDNHIAHYIEEKFFESHTKRIRELAGYAIEWKKLLLEENPVSLFLFDEYLQKSL
ncbi:Ferritin heavy chain B [Anthophora plagiata]